MAAWSEVPSGRLNAALQRLFVGLGRNASDVLDRLVDDPKYTESMVEHLVYHSADLYIDRQKIHAWTQSGERLVSSDRRCEELTSLNLQDVEIIPAPPPDTILRRSLKVGNFVQHINTQLNACVLSALVQCRERIPREWFKPIGDLPDKISPMILFGGSVFTCENIDVWEDRFVYGLHVSHSRPGKYVITKQYLGWPLHEYHALATIPQAASK